MPQQPESTSVTVVAGPAERGHRGRRADDRLLVAVAVEQRLRAPALAGTAARGRAPRSRSRNSSRSERLRRDRAAPRRCAPARRTRRRSVSRHDGSSPTMATPRAAYGMQARHVPRRVLARLVQHALGDERPAAALAVDEHDPVAGRLQQLDRGAADLGRVVGDERVVEEHHLAARRGGRRACAASNQSVNVSRGEAPAAAAAGRCPPPSPSASG